MKKVLIISILVILCSPNILNAEVDIKTTFQNDFYSYAIVKYTNSTDKFFKLVSVVCTVYASPTNNYTNSRSFSSLEHGVILPWFTETFILEFFLQGLPLKKIHCYCINWE